MRGCWVRPYCVIDVHVCETVTPSLRSAEPVLYRHRQREAVVADRRHGSMTPTGGGGAGGGAFHVPHQRGCSETKCTFLYNGTSLLRTL